MTPHSATSASRMIVATLALLLWRAQSDALAQAVPEAVQQADALLAQGKPDEAVRFVDQQIYQRRLDSTGEERYQLLMLKGIGLIQSSKSAMAAGTFDQARRSAPNGKAAAIARAHALLVRAAPGNKYTPRGSGAAPIDLVSPESRQTAFDALRADLFTAVKPKIDRATQAKTLPPALECLPAILDVASLEMASKGTTDETRADVSALSEHARGMMTAQLDKAKRRITQLGDQAFSIEDRDRRGLFSNEVKELPLIIDELHRIEKAARDVRSRAQELGMTATAWEPIALEAADLAEQAERIAEFGAPSHRN